MKKSIFIFFVIILSGCSQKNKIPAGILSQQRMYTIMWDMLRADEYINFPTKVSDTTRLKMERGSIYEQVFRLHATNQSEFKKSISFYQTRPDLLKVIIDSLRSLEKAVTDNQLNAVIQAADSVKNESNVKPLSPK